jgi:large subunit ribosomal protein L4
MKAAALRGALSDRARFDRIHVVDSIVKGEAPSAKEAAAFLSGLTERPNLLVVLQRGDEVTMKSVRNLQNVHVLVADQLNTYDVLCADDIVFTKAAFDSFVAGPAKADAKVAPKAAVEVAEAAPAKAEKAAKPAKAAAAEKPAKAAKPAKVAEVAAADAEWAGSAAPLEDGSAPEGYAIKGNKDSMKYHEPDGRWYDATIAEVWFKTAADAEAAGFVKAGTSAATKEDSK